MGLAPFWGKILIFTRFLRNSMAMIKARHFVNSACAIFSLWKQDPPHQTFPSLPELTSAVSLWNLILVQNYLQNEWTLVLATLRYVVCPKKFSEFTKLQTFGCELKKTLAIVWRLQSRALITEQQLLLLTLTFDNKSRAHLEKRFCKVMAQWHC